MRRPLYLPSATFRSHHQRNARLVYNIFNAAEYRFYRSNTGPPLETDTPFATNATLPDTPADTYANGTWYISVSFYNGILDSGFLPVGPNGETYLRLDLTGGAEVTSPPEGPGDWRLEQRAGGVVAVIGFYIQTGTSRATSWSIARTFDGSTPAEDADDESVTMTTLGLNILEHDLAAQGDGTTVKVRLQTKTASAFSEGSEVKTTTADASGPAGAESGYHWPGVLE